VADADVIVVGSGASAVNAAAPLIAAGRAVRMLDVGNVGGRYPLPDGPFEEVRRRDPQQHRYLLGDRFEGIGFEHVGAGAQLTPPRQFVCEDADRLQPVASTSFFPLHSLAEGGLAGAWGAGAPCFVDSDFAGFPIGHADLAPHYEEVAARIGINGTRDDLWPFLGELDALQPPVEIDHNGRTILDRYARVRDRKRTRGLYLGRPRLAMLTQALRGREPNRLWDTDFWSDTGKSVYRPRWTVEELRASSRFELVARKLVVAFAERDGWVEVTARDVDTQQLETHRARTLVLGAGTLGSTRIALRSLAPRGARVPIVCNPHTYMPLLNVNQLGKPISDARHSLAQACVVHAPDGIDRPFTVGHLYSYRSLLMFRLMKDAPLPHREGLEILRHLSPNFAVLIVQHADAPTPAKYCELAGDEFTVEYAPGASERAQNLAVESAIARALLRSRCVKLRAQHAGHAASTHFAGTLPMTHRDEPLTTDRDGKLRGTRAVYVVDGSVFPALPSKGLTFTMMANANRIATGIARRA
jgi:choline dehydrogenase-like flavoprotein